MMNELNNQSYFILDKHNTSVPLVYYSGPGTVYGTPPPPQYTDRFQLSISIYIPTQAKSI